MKFLGVVFVLLVAACTFNGTAQMYPTNEPAAELGAFTVEYKDVGLSGAVAFATPDGEDFKGNYTTVDNSLVGNQWGSIYGLTPQSSLTLVSGGASIRPGSMLGTLDAFGSRGTSIQCEYTVNRRSRSGMGACTTSRGALYKMHFSVKR